MGLDTNQTNDGYVRDHGAHKNDYELKEVASSDPKKEEGVAKQAVKDPFDVVDDFVADGIPWDELTTKGKVKRVVVTSTKVILLLGMLYLFICSLGFLSSAFRLLGGKAAGEVISSKDLVTNPIAGLMIGVLATVLLQSSSTTTSIVVAMVSSEILKVRNAIYVVMGANIGTSVTNTIVAISQIADKDQFRRAFAGATVHDMFNVLCVVILLPLEVITGYLYRLTKKIIESMNLPTGDSSYNKELLKKITKPFTNLIVQLDKKVIEAIAKGDKKASDKPLLKFWCDKGSKITAAKLVTKEVNTTFIDASNQTFYRLQNVTEWQNTTVTVHTEKCKYLLHDTGLSEAAVGAILLVIALIVMCTCLILIVKTLHSILKGKIAVVIKKTFNSNFPKPFGFLTGYVAILAGAGMTILVQSSSIFTSALTPLVGLGIVSLEKVYPLTLGSNIGTTGTGILAALASSKLELSLQIALCHLFFNISGILIWYPVPYMRKIPIEFAKKLGNTTADYRWFAFVYLFLVFFLIPALIFAISLAGWKVFVGIMVPIAAIIIFVVVVNILQAKKPNLLPNNLRTWEWLPIMCRSLKPYDKLITKVYKRRSASIRKDITV